ncbi:hypothetical protein V1505DRAFT_424145 [Lipomyces doorenjongii]
MSLNISSTFELLINVEAFAFSCGRCDHAPFDSPDKLNKHISSKHRQSSTFNYNGASYPLISAEGKYLCPKCSASMASISGLRRHLARVCGRSAHTSAAVQTDAPEAGTDAIPEEETVAMALNFECLNPQPSALEDIGFTYENIWQDAICTRCKFVVDKAVLIDHLTQKHGLDNLNEDTVLRVAHQYVLRPHLAIIWDETTENQVDDSDDEDHGSSLFNPTAFRPGSVALRGIRAQDGFKCEVCEQRLRHICVKTKEGMRTHYRRHHPDQAVEYHQVRVQAFYARSDVQSQLRVVEVTETQSTNVAPLSAFGIPEDIHSVPGHDSEVVERKDLNQFGVKFQGYTLLEIVDLSDLGNFLHNPQDESFELLKKLTLRMLEASREDTMAGFQPLLGKVMVGDSEKDYFYEVQEHATLEHMRRSGQKSSGLHG